MVQIYLIGLVIGAICGMMGTYFYFEPKYIKALEELDKPIIHTLTIEIEEETDGKGDSDSDATRWLDSWGS